MASIVHKADGRISVKHKVGDKWVWEHLGRGPAAQELAERKCYDYNINAAPAPTVMQFGELVLRYLQSRVHMAPINHNKLVYRFNGCILPLLGDLDATNINHEALNNFIATRKTQARTATNQATGWTRTCPLPSMQTIQGDVSCIMAVLNWAAFRCQPPLISDNHARGFYKGRMRCAIIAPPTEAEISALLSHAAPHLVRAIILDIMCGARPGRTELFRLTWDSVNFADNTITVLSANKGGISRRDIPLSRSLCAHLLQWREEDLKTGDSYLIHYRGKPVNTLQHAWRNAKRRAGITRKLRMYDFRHYFASKMLEGGSDLKSVASMMGHTDVTMVLKHYQHITSKMKRAAINTIPDIELLPTDTTGTTKKKSTVIKLKQKQVVNR